MIKLNALEVKLFETFRCFLKTQDRKVTLRVAGGWVRDKILGKESTDIDIALDTFSGEKFAEMFHQYLKANHFETHGFGVIRRNPEKSKHLETATIQIFNCWIDFVNLRGEEYNNDSPVPLLAMGTPESDAFRRDFTINSLFYNINEDKVEDFTGMGIRDLELGIIRTPLDPRQTFTDDPLRILRGFRFGVRFGFKLDPRIFEVIKQKEIRECFVNKISRERIGIEFTSNFEKNQNLCSAFDFFVYIYESGFWPLILNSEKEDLINQGFENMKRVNALMGNLLEDFEYANKFWRAKEPTRELRIWEFVQFSFLAVLTLDFYDKKTKDFRKSFAFHTIVNSLKMPNRFGELSWNLQRGIFELGELLESGCEDIGMYAMWTRSLGPVWRLSESLYGIVRGKNGVGCQLNVRKLLGEAGVGEFYAVKPLLDGKELAELFEVSGIMIKEKQTEMLRWQAMNPLGKKEDYFQKCKGNNLQV